MLIEIQSEFHSSNSVVQSAEQLEQVTLTGIQAMGVAKSHDGEGLLKKAVRIVK